MGETPPASCASCQESLNVKAGQRTAGINLTDAGVFSPTDCESFGKATTVVVGTNCTDNQHSNANSATFTNAPLADIQVNFRDGGSGETSATSIVCDNDP